MLWHSEHGYQPRGIPDSCRQTHTFCGGFCKHFHVVSVKLCIKKKNPEKNMFYNHLIVLILLFFLLLIQMLLLGYFSFTQLF